MHPVELVEVETSILIGVLMRFVEDPIAWLTAALVGINIFYIRFHARTLKILETDLKQRVRPFLKMVEGIIFVDQGSEDERETILCARIGATEAAAVIRRITVSCWSEPPIGEPLQLDLGGMGRIIPAGEEYEFVASTRLTVPRPGWEVNVVWEDAAGLGVYTGRFYYVGTKYLSEMILFEEFPLLQRVKIRLQIMRARLKSWFRGKST